MDMTKYAESEYLNSSIVVSSVTKKLVIIAPCEERMYEGKMQPNFRVSIDGKIKLWRPNQETIQNMIRAWGADDSKWIGKVVDLSVRQMSNNKQGIIGIPGQPLPKANDL